MLVSLKTALLIAAGAGITGAAIFCPLCPGGVARAAAEGVAVGAPIADTATARLHISNMTCGSCPATARIALRKLPGIYDAVVTLNDSLGVVRYDPHRVTPDQIAAHLTRLTGFGATVLKT